MNQLFDIFRNFLYLFEIVEFDANKICMLIYFQRRELIVRCGVRPCVLFPYGSYGVVCHPYIRLAHEFPSIRQNPGQD